MAFKLTALAGAAALAGGAVIIFAAPASAMPNCQGGNTPWGGGTYCDDVAYADGSYDHCTTVNVLGFGGTQCGRVCPPDPANPAVPLPWSGAPCPFPK